MTTMPVSEPLDAARLAALRAGAERTFAELVDELSPRMLKLAGVYVTGAATAEGSSAGGVDRCPRKSQSVCGPLFARDVGSGHCVERGTGAR